jgi:antitoxin VapB
MNAERLVRFFRNGRNRAIRIPREFELDAEEAIIRREDDRLVIEPIRKKGLLATLCVLDEDFPDIDKGMPPLDDWAERYADCRARPGH